MGGGERITDRYKQAKKGDSSCWLEYDDLNSQPDL